MPDSRGRARRIRGRGLVICTPATRFTVERDLDAVARDMGVRSVELCDGGSVPALFFPRAARALLGRRQVEAAALVVPDLRRLEVGFLYRAVAALANASRIELRDLDGRRWPLTRAGFLGRDVPAFLWAGARGTVALARGRLTIRRLLRSIRREPRPTPPARPPVAILRTDFWTGVEAGGAVAHTAGVAEAFAEMGWRPFFVALDRPRAVDPSIPVHLVPPGDLVRFLPEVPDFAYTVELNRAAREIFRRERPGLIYQRYSHGNLSGVLLARELGVPCVLEFNGSFVWTAPAWGGVRLVFERLELLNERASLRAADAVVSVSDPLRDYVLGMDVGPRRAMSLPNATDPDRFDPARLADARRRIRAAHGIADGQPVVGFIGTFGLWHGAEMLARAVKPVLARRPDARFLFVGDGPRGSEVRRILDADGTASAVVLTGLVPQAEGPAHLAACDVAASPHVPNADGSPFFGSPTKLFEYMASARPIVASRLDQIAELLEHERTALLVPPADPAALAEAILRLLDDPALGARLGAAARAEVIERHTWRHRVEAILARLGELEGTPP